MLQQIATGKVTAIARVFVDDITGTVVTKLYLDREARGLRLDSLEQIKKEKAEHVKCACGHDAEQHTDGVCTAKYSQSSVDRGYAPYCPCVRLTIRMVDANA